VRIVKHLLLGTDTASGILIFIIVSVLFGVNFGNTGNDSTLMRSLSADSGIALPLLAFFGFLGLTVLAAHSPDADFAPYLLLRKRMGWVSHRVVGHHPIALLPLSYAVGWSIGGTYGGTLAVCAVIAHLINDTSEPRQGFHWLSPLSWWSITIATWPPRVIPEEERRTAHQALAARTADGGQILGRLGAGPSPGEVMYAVGAYVALVLFSLTLKTSF